jgi:hypothetical protein
VGVTPTIPNEPFFSGQFFYQGQTDKFNAVTYQAFLKKVLRKTKG